jgi:hypothetical protein
MGISRLPFTGLEGASTRPGIQQKIHPHLPLLPPPHWTPIEVCLNAQPLCVHAQRSNMRRIAIFQQLVKIPKQLNVSGKHLVHCNNFANSTS